MQNDEQQQALKEIEQELSGIRTPSSSPQSMSPLHNEHHTKKHIAILIGVAVLLVGALIFVSWKMNQTLSPEETLQKLRDSSAPITETPEERAQLLESLTLPASSGDEKNPPSKEEIKKAQEKSQTIEQETIDSFNSLMSN